MPLDPTINRVSAMIRRQQSAIAQRFAAGKVTQQQMADLHKTLCMEVREYCRFQELKSLAVAAGTLTLEEGQTIYDYLGESVETFNRQSVAVKAVLTQIFQELLEMRIRTKRRAG